MSIVATGISKRFGDFVALDNVSLEVPAGSLTALLGPSGSGKSTLLRVIAGLELPDAGSVVISGEDATALAPQQRGVGFVFQHYAAFKHMTVRNNVAFGLKIRKRPKAEIRERVDTLLELVQLQQFAHRYPAQLSGGQRQRMALARALAVEPQVLLLDEPFGALDARVRAELREWLRRLHEEVHVTTVFVTHDQEEAMEVADQIAVLNHGRLEQVGGPRELYDEPASEFVMSFVGPTTRFGDEWVRPHDLELVLDPVEGAIEAMIERVVHLGFEIRVELVAGDGEPLSAQLTRDACEQLELAVGQIVYVRATRSASDVSSSTPRMLDRSSIQTSRSGAAAPV
jgi:sulfate transport system ATP-binding protein